MSEVEIRKEGLTLELSRVIAAPREAVWQCWTNPELLKQWFCPKPWFVPKADMDVRPGGRFNTVMAGPEGELFENVGMFLEVVDGEKLTFTDAYSEGYVPRENAFMTGYVELADVPGVGTRFTWGARHTSEADRNKHLEMGFEEGWKAASTQLDELARSIAIEGLQTIPAFSAKVRTCLFFSEKGEEAAKYYTSLLPDSVMGSVFRPDPNGPVLVAEFTLAGSPFMILNGNPDMQPSYLTSISILTEDQAETDRLWQALLADGGEEGQCGWLKDRYGVHWQIVPKALPRLMHAGNPERAGRVSAALMKMRKIDIAGLEAAA
ncbi:3-demethylubiquinone-9 3-methyltransferase [Labrenzia sp. THAF35]|uniref:VOC family protein n=1 Tax=Labrenzia sp. THAF35 TaxID=2587854 RepID=UPI0012A93CD6|nr:VOC family protein [Labrenzia sp. THAF35]QFT68857.1 3-demethylubiquinone-9 3-methyltransferase [Labrenzia sp. THAF35]